MRSPHLALGHVRVLVLLDALLALVDVRVGVTALDVVVRVRVSLRTLHHVDVLVLVVAGLARVHVQVVGLASRCEGGVNDDAGLSEPFGRVRLCNKVVCRCPAPSHTRKVQSQLCPSVTLSFPPQAPQARSHPLQRRRQMLRGSCDAVCADAEL